MGENVGEKIARAVERATQERLPVEMCIRDRYTTDREKNDKKREDMSWYFLFFIHI